MNKSPINVNWFDELKSPNLAGRFQWLFQLQPMVNSIVSFGCLSSEPFALMWALDAIEIKIIEREKSYIDERKQEREYLSGKIPDALKGRSIEFVWAEMLSKEGIYQYSDNRFDLAYSEAFLKYIFKENNLQAIEEAVAQMARVVKPGGWVIAVGVITEDQLTHKDISEQFRRAGLFENSLDGIPEFAYCYRKRS